jgi:hypothetical protein
MTSYTDQDIRDAFRAGWQAHREEVEGKYPLHGYLPAARRCGYYPKVEGRRLLTSAFIAGYEEGREPGSSGFAASPA